MTSSTIRSTGFQSSLSLSPEDNSKIFCHSFNGDVKWTGKKCNCISYILKITFLNLLKGSHLKLGIWQYWLPCKLPWQWRAAFSSLLLWHCQLQLAKLCKFVITTCHCISLPVSVTSFCTSSIRSPYFCSKHLMISWIKCDRFRSRYSFLCSKFFNVVPWWRF